MVGDKYSEENTVTKTKSEFKEAALKYLQDLQKGQTKNERP